MLLFPRHQRRERYPSESEIKARKQDVISWTLPGYTIFILFLFLALRSTSPTNLAECRLDLAEFWDI